MEACRIFPLLFLLLLWVRRSSFAIADGRPDPFRRPAMARWLVRSNTWGVVSTVSIHLRGAPFGNIASYSDGPPSNSTGIPYFYLSKLDPTPQDLAANSSCSFTISESPLGSCGQTDVEDPTCAKLTLSGQMQLLKEDDMNSKFAQEALFSKHPEMAGWPKGHKFRFYKLIIESIFLIDWYGGAKPVSLDDYFLIDHNSS